MSLLWNGFQFFTAETLPASAPYFWLACLLFGTSYWLSRSPAPLQQGISKAIFSSLLLLVFTRLFFVGGAFASPIVVWLILLPLFFRVTVSKAASRWSAYYVALVLIIEIVLNKVYGISFASPYITDFYTMGLFNIPLAFVLLLFINKSYEHWRDASHQKDLAIIEEQQKTLAAQKAFMANMSHEIRTPLSGIYGALQLMEQQATPSKELVAAAKDASQRLKHIVDDILDIEKLLLGKVKLKPDWYPVDRIFNTLQMLFTPSAESKGLTLTVKRDEQLPGRLFVDEQRLSQILNNLVNNAIKFTLQGSVQVEVSYVRDQLCVHVIDTGIGMREEDLSHLFDRFTQADGSKNKAYQGTGLGMAISKELTELMGGELDVASEYGKGTAFTLRLPLEARELPTPEVASAAASTASDLRPWRVLLVEDDATNRFVAEQVLSPRVKTLISAVDGLDGLKQFQAHSFDLVITDINMPNMNGEQLFEQIRNLSPGMPIVALSGNAYGEDKAKLVEMGFNLVLGKPIQAHVLLAGLDAVMRDQDEERSDAPPMDVIESQQP